MAPSRCLKQCRLIIKLMNKILWHLHQWIIIKDLKIQISKMRLKLALYYNFTSSPEIIHFICIILCHGGKLIFIVPIFSPSECCLGYPPPPPPPPPPPTHTHTHTHTPPPPPPPPPPPMCLLWPHYRGAMFQELKTTLLHEKSVTWKIMTSVKAKIWKLLVN